MDTARRRNGSIGLNDKIVKKGQMIEYKTTGKV
jgi:hypothetical protein